MGVDPFQFLLDGFRRMRGGAGDAETAGAADRGNHGAAMAESQQWKFNSQHVADRRFHGGAHSLRQLFGAARFWFECTNSNGDASASGTGKPSGFPASNLARSGYGTGSRANTFRVAKYARRDASRQRRFVACAFDAPVECWSAISKKSQGSANRMSALQSISGKSHTEGSESRSEEH